MLEIGFPEWVAYEVHGTTLTEVHDVIRTMPEAGSCDWSESTYSVSWGDDGKVTDVEAVIRIKVTMPAWVEVDQAPQEAQDEWNRFWAALEAHEQGHIDIVSEKLADVDTGMIGKTEAEAGQVWNTAFDELNKASKAYDDGNNHGQNEGTILDLDAGAPAETEESSEGESTEDTSS